MASTTRQLLSVALKDQLRSTPLDKVTVSSLTAQAGITRQTFYYHFADVYDLAVWVFEQEVANHIMEHASYSEWAKGYRTLLQYLQDNFEQAKAVLNSLGHRERDAFFLEQFRNMMEAIVTELEGDLVLTPEDRQFVVDHYAATVLGHFLRWVSMRQKEDPRILVANIEKILHGTVRQSLERFSEGGSKPRTGVPK